MDRHDWRKQSSPSPPLPIILPSLSLANWCSSHFLPCPVACLLPPFVRLPSLLFMSLSHSCQFDFYCIFIFVYLYASSLLSWTPDDLLRIHTANEDVIFRPCRVWWHISNSALYSILYIIFGGKRCGLRAVGGIVPCVVSVCAWRECGSVCECVSDSRLCLVDGAIQSRRRAPQKCRLVMSTLFQDVCGGMPGALFPFSFSLSIFCTTNSHKDSFSNWKWYTCSKLPFKTDIGILNVSWKSVMLLKRCQRPPSKCLESYKVWWSETSNTCSLITSLWCKYGH